MILFLPIFFVSGSWLHPQKRDTIPGALSSKSSKRSRLGDSDEDPVTSNESISDDDSKFASLPSGGTDRSARWALTRHVLDLLETNQGDAGLFVPNLDAVGIEGLGSIRVSWPIATSWSNVVFEGGMEDKKIVIKYGNDCEQRLQDPSSVTRNSNELVNEFNILYALRTSTIVPQVYLLSAPVRLTQTSISSWKVQSRNIGKYPRDCLEARTEVRFLVEDQVGGLLQDAIKKLRAANSVSSSELLVTILRAGISMIRLCEELHSYGIVHGDIHPGNIALRSDSLNDLIFLDFGKAFFYPNRIGTPISLPLDESLNRRLLSHWHLSGFRISMRDDVFRVAELLCNLVSNGKYWEELVAQKHVAAELAQNAVLPLLSIRGALSRQDQKRTMQLQFGQLLSEIKSDYIFYDSLEEWHDLDVIMQLKVEKKLGEFLDLIHSIDHPDTVPPYEQLVTKLEDTIKYIHSVTT
jgi:hypothetical protein